MCALLQVQPSEGCSELTHKGSFLFQNATISNEAQTSRVTNAAGHLQQDG